MLPDLNFHSLTWKYVKYNIVQYIRAIYNPLLLEHKDQIQRKPFLRHPISQRNYKTVKNNGERHD